MPDTYPTEHELDMILLLGRVDANVVTLLNRTAIHDTRLQSLEKSHWTIKAALAGVAGLVFKDHIPAFITNMLT